MASCLGVWGKAPRCFLALMLGPAQNRSKGCHPQGWCRGVGCRLGGTRWCPRTSGVSIESAQAVSPQAGAPRPTTRRICRHRMRRKRLVPNRTASFLKLAACGRQTKTGPRTATPGGLFGSGGWRRDAAFCRDSVRRHLYLVSRFSPFPPPPLPGLCFPFFRSARPAFSGGTGRNERKENPRLPDYGGRAVFIFRSVGRWPPNSGAGRGRAACVGRERVQGGAAMHLAAPWAAMQPAARGLRPPPFRRASAADNLPALSGPLLGGLPPSSLQNEALALRRVPHGRCACRALPAPRILHAAKGAALQPLAPLPRRVAVAPLPADSALCRVAPLVSREGRFLPRGGSPCPSGAACSAFAPPGLHAVTEHFCTCSWSRNVLCPGGNPKKAAVAVQKGSGCVIAPSFC